MFSSVGWGEILVLLLAALFIFGPDKLPGAVKQAKDVLKNVRKQISGARRQLNDEFADVVPSFDPAMLNPKEFIRRSLFEDDEDELGDADAARAERSRADGDSRADGEPGTGARPGASDAPAIVVRYDDETT